MKVIPKKLLRIYKIHFSILLFMFLFGVFHYIKPSFAYTPDGAYMTYEDGSPVAYELSFSFQELEPIYDKDYESGDGAKGMGF